jgi:hypothetical protein
MWVTQFAKYLLRSAGRFRGLWTFHEAVQILPALWLIVQFFVGCFNG